MSSERRPIIVQKYGGSSVATVERLRAVAEKVVATRRSGYGVVVVVSAMGNTTDDLLALAREVSAQPPRRELDMLLSVGERISMALLSTAIQDLGEQAISFTGSQCGIVTTDSHANARIIDVRPFRVQDELERGRIVIVAGFQGTSYRREITTLGRGGSDTTAVALAAALGAVSCDIYSDVDGVYTADPRVVVDAERLEAISFEEMQELARQGARVLNAQAVEFARRRQIAIYARSTFGGDGHTVVTRADGFPETALRELRGFGAAGVAGSRQRMICTYEGMRTGENRADVMLELLAESGATCVATTATPGSDRLEVLIDTSNVADADSLAKRLRRELDDTVTVSTGLGTASVVGQGVGDEPGALLLASRTLADARIPMAMLASSREAVVCAVRGEVVDDAVRALHTAFITSPPGSPST